MTPGLIMDARQRLGIRITAWVIIDGIILAGLIAANLGALWIFLPALPACVTIWHTMQDEKAIRRLERMLR